MVKQLITFLLIQSFFVLSAQNYEQISLSKPFKIEPIKNHLTPDEPNIIYPKSEHFTRVTNQGVGIGQGPNAYGVTGIRNNVSANQDINTIAFIHRSDYLSNSDNTNGALRFDFSINGGANWQLNQGPIWNPASVQGFHPGPARFPNMGIYNPPGNTNPSQVYLSIFASTLNGDNDNWGGQLYGCTKLDNSQNYMHTDSSANGNGWYVVNSDFEVVNNKSIGLNFSRKSNGIDFVFQDTLVVHNGTWNNNIKEYNYTKVFIPMTFKTNGYGEQMFTDAKVALDQNGQVGYISILGNKANYGTSGLIHPVIYKTTNGGSTWSGPYNIYLDSLIEVESQKKLIDLYRDADSSITINNLSTGSEHDLIVDKNGNPHLCINIFPAGKTTISNNGTTGDEYTVISNLNAILDIFSIDGGMTWKSRIVGQPNTWRGLFGTAPQQITEENRPQIAKTKDGSKLFYFWFDTPPSWGTYENIYPDVYMSGFDLDKDSVISSTYRATYHGNATFGNVAPQIWESTTQGHYEAHLVTQELNPNYNGDLTYPTQFAYYKISYFNSVSVETIDISPFTLKQNFPNPVKDITTFTINASLKGDYNLTITSITGQVMLNKNLGHLPVGINRISANLSTFAQGVYLYTISSDKGSQTKKLMVQ